MNDLPNRRPRRFGAQFVITVLLVLIAAGAGWKTAHLFQVDKPLREVKDENGKLQLGLSGSDEGMRLAERFADADGDLVADPPRDAKDLVDPPKLVFSYIAQEEAEKYEQLWKPFCDHLSKVTGKPVEYLVLHSTEDQLKALADGSLQVTGLSTGAVPVAVNNCGFVPVCRVPTNDPKGTHIEIIVP